MRELVRSQDICGKDLAIKASGVTEERDLHETQDTSECNDVQWSFQVPLPVVLRLDSLGPIGGPVQLAAWVPLLLFWFYAVRTDLVER